LTVPLPASELYSPAHRAADTLAEYFRDAESRAAAHPVLKRIKSLPTPMLLGIDRTGRLTPDGDDRYYLPPRPLRNVFQSSLHPSLIEAQVIAEREFGGIQTRQRALADNLRSQIILEAMRYRTTEDQPGLPAPVPPNRISAIKATLRSLGISDGDVRERLD